MQTNLPKNARALSPIKEAAAYLGVSIATIRRWDRAGRIHSVRTAGNIRRFPKEELDRVKNVSKKGFLSIGQAASELSVSIQTLRRWDKQGLIKPGRNEIGERVFPRELIEDIKSIKEPKTYATPIQTKGEIQDHRTPSIPDKFHQKVIHHIKHTRPAWYHRYHERGYVRTIHLVILVIFLLLLGSYLFDILVVKPRLDKIALSSTNIDARLLSGLKAEDFLRSNTSDTFETGTLTTAEGTTLLISGTFECTECVTDPTVVDGLTISGGTIDDSPIGLASPSTGSFTSLNANAGLIVSAGTTTISSLDCTVNLNGGSLTTDAFGVLTCSNDDVGGTGVTAHGALTGLLIDDHTQYALLTGRGGGQVLNGGTLAGQTLTLRANAVDTSGILTLSGSSPHASLTGDLTISGDMRINGDDILDSGGTPRITLATASPHVNITGDLDVSENIIFRSGTVFNGSLDHGITSDHTWTFPDTTGTVALVDGITRLIDADLDTKVDVEESADEDIIRFDIAGNQKLQLDSTTLWLDDPTTGSTVDSPKLKLTGNHKPAFPPVDFEVGFTVFADITSNTDYKLSFLEKNGSTEIAYLDESGNFHITSLEDSGGTPRLLVDTSSPNVHISGEFSVGDDPGGGAFPNALVHFRTTGETYGNVFRSEFLIDTTATVNASGLRHFSGIYATQLTNTGFTTTEAVGQEAQEVVIGGTVISLKGIVATPVPASAIATTIKFFHAKRLSYAPSAGSGTAIGLDIDDVGHTNLDNVYGIRIQEQTAGGTATNPILQEGSVGTNIFNAASQMSAPGVALDVQNTTDAVSNEVLRLRGGDKTTAADNDESYIGWMLEENGGTNDQIEFGRLAMSAVDVTSTTKDSRFIFYGMNDNSLEGAVSIGMLPNASALNDPGIRLNAHGSIPSGILTFVDGELFEIGINTPPVGTPVAGRPGMVLRFDTRVGVRTFILRGYDGSSFETMFQIPMHPSMSGGGTDDDFFARSTGTQFTIRGGTGITNAIADVRASTANRQTAFRVIPNGSPSGTRAIFQLYGTDAVADATNINALQFITTSTPNIHIRSRKAGTGTQMPIIFDVDNNGSIVEAMRIDTSAQVIINEDGGDQDFRVEGVNDTDLFFVDASTDRVGISTNSPDTLFHVAGAGHFDDDVEIGNRITIGNNASPNDEIALFVNHTWPNDISNNVNAQQFTTSLSQTSSSYGNILTGIRVAASVGAANDQNWTHAIGLRGFSSQVTNLSFLGGTVTGAAAYYVEGITDLGTLTNAYGMYIEALTGGTNNYGIYINTPTGTIADAIHAVGGRAYFGGSAVVADGLIVNEDGGDNDTRIEGLSDDNLLFVDAGLDTITIGSQTSLGKFGIDGDQDEIQLLVQGNGTQNANIFEIENSGATNLLTVDNSGNTTIAGTLTVQTAETTLQLSATQASQRLCGTHADATAGSSIIRDCGAGQADFAEYYGSDGSVAATDLVAIATIKEAVDVTDPLNGKPTSKAWVIKTNRAYQKELVGIVSTNPFAEVLGEDLFTQDEHPVPIALSGRVPVKVSTENGSIRPGDPLTSSSTPGVAMKATKAGYVVGRSLGSYDGTGIGTVIVFVNPHYTNPIASSLLNLDSENSIVVTISAGANFIWKNSLGEIVAWISDTGEVVINKVTALVGDFGQVVVGELIFKKEAKTAGVAGFEPGKSEVFISSDKVAGDSLIYVTPTANPGEAALYIKDKVVGRGFTVALGGSSEIEGSTNSEGIEFNWLIVNQE